MLAMINAQERVRGYGDIAAGEALIEAQRMLVAANMETMG